MKIVGALVSLVAVGVLSGCGGNDSASQSQQVPPAPIERELPKGYRVLDTFDANLTDGKVPDKVVSAIGPPTSHDGALPLTPATVLVLSWDAKSERWAVVFDAQKTMKPRTYGDPRTSNGGPGRYQVVEGDPLPLLDPLAAVELELVDSAPLLTKSRDELVFSAWMNYGGSGVPQILAVVDFEHGKPEVLYAWSGEHLELSLQDDRILATSSVWTRNDSHCCPSRDYRFVVGLSGDRITELEDERPYLGVLVRERGEYYGEGPYEIVGVSKGSPAAGVLRRGDVLLDIANPSPRKRPYYNPRKTFYAKLASFDAGDTAQTVISRDGAKLTVPVRLDSLKDAVLVPIPGEDFEAL